MLEQSRRIRLSAHAAGRLLHVARAFVVQTSGLPLLGSSYRGVYALQVRRAAALLRDIDGVRAVYLRGGNTHLVPGLSDLDLDVVLDDAKNASVELVAIERVGMTIRTLNRIAPLFGEVHFILPGELRTLARVHSGLHGVLAHTRLLHGDPSLPVADDSPLLAREALLRQLSFETARTLASVSEDGVVGRGLASRVHAKALAAAAELEKPDGSPAALWAAYARGKRVPASLHAVMELLRRLDAAIPDAPEIDPEERCPHPTISRVEPAIRQWFARLSRQPGIEAAVLSIEGARESDPRFYVALDLEHPRAEESLRAIGKAALDGSFPRQGFTRFPRPIVVTPRQLERSVFLRWTALEPVARSRHAVALQGAASVVKATHGEIARGLLLDWVGSATRLREGFAHGTVRDDALYARDVLAGVLPAVDALARGGEHLTRAVESAEASGESYRLDDRARKLDVLERLREVASGSGAALAELVAALR